jgi:hypothetical protein
MREGLNELIACKHSTIHSFKIQLLVKVWIEKNY